jgi:hypothetical protein
MGCAVSTVASAAPASSSATNAAAAGDQQRNEGVGAPDATDGGNNGAGELCVLVRSATGLRDVDGVGGGESDPYCRLRVGAAGTSFDSKPTSTERCSQTVLGGGGTVAWHFAARFAPSPAPDDELHVLVLDRDVVSDDDALGEARVPIGTLCSHGNESREYPLSQGGSVTLLSGSVVQQALVERLREEKRNSEGSGWLRGGWFGALGQWFERGVASTVYWGTMAKFGIHMAAKNFRFTQYFLSNADSDWVADGYPFAEDCISCACSQRLSCGGRWFVVAMYTRVF